MQASASKSRLVASALVAFLAASTEYCVEKMMPLLNAVASHPAVDCASIRQLQAECQFALSAVICAEQSSRRILILLIVQLTVVFERVILKDQLCFRPILLTRRVIE